MKKVNLAVIFTLLISVMFACKSNDTANVSPATSNTITLTIGESKPVLVPADITSSYVIIKFDSVSDPRATRDACMYGYAAWKPAKIYCEIQVPGRGGWNTLVLQRNSCIEGIEDSKQLFNNRLFYKAAGINFVVNFLTNIDDVIAGQPYSVTITAVD